MASRQSGEVAKLYRSWLAAPAQDPEWTMADQRAMVEGWDVLTAEPGGVDYLETEAGGVPALWAVPGNSAADRVILALHGGGFISGSRYTHRKMYAHLAKAVGARALIPEYRLLPEGVYPAPVEDALAAYGWLLEQGVEPGHLAVAGDSVGGGLAVTLQLRARDGGLPLPVASMLISPSADPEVTGETMRSNADRDALFNQAWVQEMAEAYLNGTSPQDPYANLLRADLTGLGPMYLQVGADELLLDDSRRLAERAEKHGVDVRLDVFPEQQHTFQMMAGRAPEADDAIGRLADWVRPRLGL
jgi:monoterpene epsilon-lactone hydrolase